MSAEPAQHRIRRNHTGLWQAATAMLGLFTRLPSCPDCTWTEWECICMDLSGTMAGPALETPHG